MEISELYELYVKHPVVTTDSRVCPEGSIFFAMKGASFNGNEFASKAIESGCAYAVVDEAGYAVNDRIILVDDCLKTLQDLAHYHRKTLGTRIVGITGTNGKTTTKELVATALGARYKVLYTQGNFNNHLGVPLTLLRLTAEHEMAVIEMGANHPGEIKTLVDIVEPDFGLITNVGKAHLEGFGSFEGVKRTKGELYDYLRAHGCKAFLNADSEDLCQMAQGLTSIPYGQGEGNYVQGVVTKADPYISVAIDCFDEKVEIPTHLIGTYNLPNFLAAVCVARYFGVTLKAVAKALGEYVPTNNRSQLTRTERNTLIVDAYNANPTSMAAALANFKAIEANDKCLILGDMGELGADSHSEHEKVSALITESGIGEVYLIGKNFMAVRDGFNHFESTDAFRSYLAANPISGKTILVKGSNSMKLTSLIELL